MNKVRVAIIGQGRSGRNIHGAHLINAADRFQIVAVADLLEDRRQRAVAEYGCEAVADYHDLLKRRDLDLIVNSTPSHQHVPVTLEILQAGFNVLCEKPLAKTVKEVDELIAAAKKAKKIFAIFQQSRFAPYFQQVREVIRSGVLGRIVQISIAFNGFGRRWDWQTLQSWNGGNLLNTGPHPLDQALQLFGEGMPAITCFMDRANTWGDAEDHVKLTLSGQGHPVIDLEISSSCAYPCFTYNLYGAQGGLKGNTTRLEWRYFKPAEAPKHELTTNPICHADGTPAYCTETLPWHTGEWAWDPTATKSAGGAYNPAAVGQAPVKGAGPKASSDMFEYMAARFYDMLYKTLTAGAPLEITPEQVRRIIAVIEECHRQNPEIYRKPRK